MSKEIIDAFSYGYDIANAIKEHKDLPVDEIHSAGSRKSGKSYSHEGGITICCNVIDKDFKTVPVVAYGLRNNLQKAPELYSEFVQTADRFGFRFEANKTERTIKFANGNGIRVMHLHSQGSAEDRSNWSGLARAENAEYIFIFVEEAYECDRSEVQRFVEAVRGNKDTKVLIIGNCNPGSRRSKYIQFLDQHLKFCEYKLRTNGQQIRIIEDNTHKEDTGKATKMLFHYTNGRVNKENLSPSDIKSILGVYRTDPDRAKTTDLGLPGFQQGAIYAYLLKYCKPAVGQRHRYIGGGGDFGYGNTPKSGITAFYFGGSSPGLGTDIYREGSHDNKENELDPYIEAEEIVKFYMKCRSEYYQRTGYLISGNGELVVRCDGNDLMSISVLNRVAQEKFRLNGLCFTKCAKYKNNDRIKIEKYSMARGEMRIDPSCECLLSELEIVQGDMKKFKQEVREDKNDHGINGGEYFLEPAYPGLIDDKDKLAFRKMLSNRTFSKL